MKNKITLVLSAVIMLTIPIAMLGEGIDALYIVGTTSLIGLAVAKMLSIKR